VSEPDLISELRNYLPEGAYLAVVHRLDQPVEGLLVFAKTKKAAKDLSKKLQENSLSKIYYAVSLGEPSKKEGILEDYLIKNGSRAEITTADLPGAKKAVLHYRLLSVKQGCVLYEICLKTGRFHQIRTQMLHAGMPLLGDRKYGNEESVKYSEEHGIRSVALCACELKLDHPVTKRPLSFRIKPKGGAFDIFFEE